MVVDVTPDEMARLYELAVRPRTLRAAFGRSAIVVCESNRWAVDLLVEWRRPKPAAPC